MSHDTTKQKVLLLTGMVFISISEGYIIGFMSGMIAGLRSKESDTKYTDNQISWLGTSIHIMSLLGFGLAALITEKLGRRYTLTILATPVVFYWLIVYFDHRFAVLMTSTVMLGICFGGVLSLALIATAEYTSPKIRGVCLSFIISCGPALGVKTSHILSTVLHWKNVALIGIVPAAFAALIPYFCVESPTWLASKGRFEECETTFKLLHGDSKEAQNELRLLIELEKCKQSKKSQAPTSSVLGKLWIALRKKYFWKIAIIIFVLHVYRVASAKMLLATYMITILQDITGGANMFVFTVLVDGVAIFGYALSCYLNKRFQMRPILFTSGTVASIILICLSACLYFKPSGNVLYIWLSCVLLALYYATAAAGLFPTMELLFAEIFPLELKMYCYFLFGTFGSALTFLSLKTALTVFSTLGYYGMFLMNAVVGSLCLFYLWLKLPETRGRTLQEIELYFKNDTFDKVNLDSEQYHGLLDRNVKV